MSRIHIDDAGKYQKELNGEWFSLKNDGDVATIQFMYDSYDELHAYVCHKVNVSGKDRYVGCKRRYDEPIDNCPFCAAGIPVRPVRFVLMFDHSDQKVKIWERGTQFISILQGLFNRYSPLSNYVFEIERFGKAGSKDTKYQVFPMDRAEPYDLTEVEMPELLGGLILDKDNEEMEIYLQTGNFPETQEQGQQQGQYQNQYQQQPVARRGAPQQQNQAAPSRRETPAPSRRGAAPQEQQPQQQVQTNRQPSSRRIAPQVNNEVNNDKVF